MIGCDGMVQIRRARDADARGIAEVHVASWREAYRDLLPASLLNALTVEARESNWRDELRAMGPGAAPWVAEVNGQTVGFVACGGARDETADPLTGEVYAIHVLPDCWRRGVGRSLLGHAERDLISHGYDDAVIWVLADDQRRRAFYEWVGWHADGGTRLDAIGGVEVEEVRYRIALERSRVAELV